MPSLIALSLSLITVYIVSHFSRKVKLYSHFLFALRTFEILDTVIPLADFLAGNGFVPAAQAASDFVPIVASRFDECLSAVAEVEVSANLCHCHFVFHFVVISLTHWNEYSTISENCKHKTHFISLFLFLFLRFSLTKKGAKLLITKDLRAQGGRGRKSLRHSDLRTSSVSI